MSRKTRRSRIGVTMAAITLTACGGSTSPGPKGPKETTTAPAPTASAPTAPSGASRGGESQAPDGGADEPADGGAPPVTSDQSPCPPILTCHHDDLNPVGDDQLADATRTVECYDNVLALREQELATAVAGRDAAIEKLKTQDAGDIRPLIDAARQASQYRDAAKALDDKATIAQQCIYDNYEAPRRIQHAFGFALSIAHSADEATAVAASLRYLYRPSARLQYEFLTGVQPMWRSSITNGAHPWTDSPFLYRLGARVAFGKATTLFFLGAGASVRIDSSASIAERLSAFGELGLAFRLTPTLDPDPTRCSGGIFGDGRFFIQPYLPFQEGSRVSILFGLELGGGGGWRAGRSK
jgi:hypothetical protein